MSSHTTWSGRPKFLPPASKTDMIVEVIAFIGVLLSFIIVNYSPLGGVDTYGSKWPALAIFLIPIIFVYAFITVFNRFPYYFHYNTIVTEENAFRLYRLGRSILRGLKAFLVWMLLILGWFFNILLPNNPGLSGLSVMGLLIMLLFLIVFAIIILYAAKKLKQEGKPKNTI